MAWHAATRWARWFNWLPVIRGVFLTTGNDIGGVARETGLGSKVAIRQ